MTHEDSGKRILLVDDDPDVAEMVTAFLKQKNMKVIHYCEPEKALQDFLSDRVGADLILTDLNMPGLSGLDLLQRLKKEGRTVPVILITVTNDIETAVSAIEAGAFDYAVKPLHFPQLFITIQRALRFQKLHQENKALKTAVEISQGQPDSLVGQSEVFRRTCDLARRVASTNSTVLIAGESGSGKEIFARAIHNWSPRRGKPFIAINCSAIPENLLESELFGHAKGAFTGASDKKVGLFEEADGGTLFLDEIGDMNLPLQAKLLRVLQERKVKRVGENQMRAIDVRVIAATHKDLRTEVRENRFREDLFFRLNVIPMRVPALRERKEDIIPIATFFLKKFAALNGLDIQGFTPAAKEYLLKNNWKGNVRELENTVERAVALTGGQEVDVGSFLMFDEEIPGAAVPLEDNKNAFVFRYGEKFLSLAEMEKKYIQHVFDKNNHAREMTARILGIDRKTLYRRLQDMESST